MLKILAGKIGEFKKETILTPLFMVGEVALECLIPAIMAKLIDNMYGSSLTPVLTYGGLLLLLASLSMMCGIGSARNGATASTGFARNLRRDMFYKVQEFSFEDIDKFSSASLVTRLTNDISQIQMAFSMLLRMAVRTPLMLIFSFVMTVRINARISLIFVAIIPILAIALLSIFRTAHPIFHRIFEKYDALNNSVQENVAGIRVVKSFVREDYEIEKFNKASEEVRRDFVSAERIIGLNGPIMQACIKIAILLVSYFAAKTIILTNEVELSTGQLSSLISYGVQILSAMMMLSMVFMQITFSTEAANRICEVLTHEPKLVSPPNGVTEVKDGSIVFDHVTFKYNPKSKRRALADINLDIKSGEVIGIMGATGSSKSTLVSLISRLYDVNEGSVSVGGVDVRDYDLETLRNSVSVVLQKNQLFSGTLLDNLRWGKEDATEEECKKACEMACADEFINRMPDGYNTHIEQGGTNVSGGQKQRLCIARALLKNPKILILDDSTSAVDTATDAKIRQAFRTQIPGVTKFIIAQRISSISDADRIIVLDNGRINGIGTHEELLNNNDIYREVYESQTGGAKDFDETEVD